MPGMNETLVYHNFSDAESCGIIVARWVLGNQVKS